MIFLNFFNILCNLKNDVTFIPCEELNNTTITILNYFKDIEDIHISIKKQKYIKKLIKDNDRKVYSIICDDPLYIRLFDKNAAYPDYWDMNDFDSGKSFIHFSEDGSILYSNFLQDFQNITNIKDITDDIYFYLKLQNKI